MALLSRTPNVPGLIGYRKNEMIATLDLTKACCVPLRCVDVKHDN